MVAFSTSFLKCDGLGRLSSGRVGRVICHVIITGVTDYDTEGAFVCFQNDGAGRDMFLGILRSFVHTVNPYLPVLLGRLKSNR